MNQNLISSWYSHFLHCHYKNAPQCSIMNGEFHSSFIENHEKYYVICDIFQQYVLKYFFVIIVDIPLRETKEKNLKFFWISSKINHSDVQGEKWELNDSTQWLERFFLSSGKMMKNKDNKVKFCPTDVYMSTMNVMLCGKSNIFIILINWEACCNISYNIVHE